MPKSRSSWRDFFTEASKQSAIVLLGSRDGSPVPPQTVALEDDRYLQMRLLSFYYPDARRGLTRQQPVVYSTMNWPRPSDADLSEQRLVTPSIIDHPNAKGGGAAFAFQGQSLFGPMRYNGDLQFSIGLIVNRKNAKARKAIELALKAAKPFTKTMLIVDPATDLLTEVFKQLMPDDPSQFLVGTSLSIPLGQTEVQTGTWAILSPKETARDVWLDPTDNRLKQQDGTPIDTPYLVYALDALDQNPNRARDEQINAAWKRVQEGLRATGGMERDRLEELYKNYAFAVHLSDNLNQKDKTALLADARRHFDDSLEIWDAMFETSTSTPIETKALDALEASSLAVETPEAEADATPAVSVTALSQAAIKVIQEEAPNLTAQQANADPEQAQESQEAIEKALDDLVVTASRNPDAMQAAIDAATLLRKRRMPKMVARFERKLRDHGVSEPRLSYLGALAQVDLGDNETGEALAARTLMLARERDDPFNEAETLSLLGRVWKTRAVTGKGDQSLAFVRAIDYYRAALDKNPDPGDNFQRVNLMALIAAGRKAGLTLGADLPTDKWAKSIIRAAKSTRQNAPANAWTLADGGEANLFLENDAAAADFFNRYIDAEQDNPFALNGTRRQLIQVWDIDPTGTSEMAKVVRRMAVGALTSGESFTVNERELEALSHMEDKEIDSLEATFGGPKALKASHILAAVQLGRNVAQIERPNGSHVGTGFLVAGEDLNEAWAGEQLLVTNDHVIRETPLGRMSIKPKQACIYFRQHDANKVYRVREQVWHSDWQTGHDCSIVRLTETPNVSGATFKLAAGLPPRWRGEIEATLRNDDRDSPRVFIMGHPRGEDLSITFYQNFLIDHEHTEVGAFAPPTPIRLHYRAPTDHGGSGSPVLNANTLELIGLHSRGDADKPLNGFKTANGAPYEANQGYWLQAIRAAIAADPNVKPFGEAPPIPVATAPSHATSDNAQAASAANVEASAPVETEAENTVALEAAPEAPAEEISAEDEEFAYSDNIDSRNETAETGYGSDTASLEVSQAWLAIEDKPTAKWAELNKHPDTRHLADIACVGSPDTPFKVTDAVIRKALTFAAIPIGEHWGKKILFGIRAGTVHDHSDAEIAQFRDVMTLTESTPNHRNYNCTMGVWDVSTGTFWSNPASTVPAIGYMWDQAEAGGSKNHCNMVPPGVYTYRVGTHANGGRTRQVGALRQASKLCVLRSDGKEYMFNIGDRWDVTSDANGPRIWDNIHAGLGATRKWGADFYSAGCQVMPGTVRDRDSHPRPTSYWGTFREAAGLKRMPSAFKLTGAANPNNSNRVEGTSEDGTAFVYILLTARELRIAAENLGADDHDPRFAKLRRGSQGDGVKALQEHLGLTADGDFGFLTQRALIESQLAAHNHADGIVTAQNAAEYGLSAPDVTPPEGHSTHAEMMS